MTAIQLSFTLRTSPQCKTVHLLGSWDMYRGQLPLSRDSAGGHQSSGGWKGTFKFQGSVLKRGQRYWYYYIIDGYHVSHDPCQDSTTEPTTGRRLNILDVPSSTARPPSSSSRNRSFTGSRLDTAAANASYKPRAPSSPMRYKRNSRNTPDDIPLGRPVSPSMIVSPMPKKPGGALYLTTTDLNALKSVEDLTRQFARYGVDNRRYSSSSSASSSDIDSDRGSDVPSLTDSPRSGSSLCSPHTPGRTTSSTHPRRLSTTTYATAPAIAHVLRSPARTRPRTSPAGSVSSRDPSPPGSASTTTSAASACFSAAAGPTSPASSRTSNSTSPKGFGFSRRRRVSSSAGSSSSRPGSAGSRSRAPSAASSQTSANSRCGCERYGVTRKGGRIKLDCGGGRCGYASTSPEPEGGDCGSSSDGDSFINDSGGDARAEGAAKWSLESASVAPALVLRAPRRGRVGG